MKGKVLAELKQLVGDKWVLTNPGDLHLYSFDSALDRARPACVVLPESPGQVTGVIRLLVKNKIPYVARGAATSLCGGPVPLENAVVIGLARLKDISNVNLAKKEVTVEPGVVNLKLQEAVAKDKLFYAPDPGSQKACTIGGNIATNAGGPHCLKYGVTSTHIARLEVILPDGNHARVSVDDPGYDLTGLFVGSEGTLGTVLRATLKLLPKPKAVRTMVVSFHSIEEAIQAVSSIISAGILPATLEAMDRTIVEAVEAFSSAGYPTDAEAVLLIEVDGDNTEELDTQIKKIEAVSKENGCFDVKIATDETERAKLWEGRRGSYAAMARLAPNVLVEDGAVPRTRLPEALKKIKDIAAESNLDVALLFHAGDGNLHPQILFDERDAEKTKVVKAAGHKMLKACVDLGGTISGEHGIGIDKRNAMKWLFDRETLSLFRRIKQVFDKDNLCNPDKLIPLVSKGAGVKAAPEDEAIEQMNQMGSAKPKDEAELLKFVRSWAGTKKHFGIQGTGSKYTVSETMVLHVPALKNVLEFDKGNLTLRAQCGVPLAELRALVEKENQYLWVAGEGTVGGVVATKASVNPPLRDAILGMRVLLSNGEVVTFGAKTMKNVAGYDAAKLLIGSWGTLGVILDVTFRLMPYPNKNMEAQKPRPFVMNPLHKKIQKAFDPDSILSQRMTVLTAKDIDGELKPKKQEDPALSEAADAMKKLKDKFWM